jgi:hypothetical protein
MWRLADRQTGRQTARQAERQTLRKRDSKTDAQTHRHTDTQTHRHTDIQTRPDRRRQTQTDTGTDTVIMFSLSDFRCAKVGDTPGARADRIRTYNFPQGRVTDHRVKTTVTNLEVLLLFLCFIFVTVSLFLSLSPF